MLDLSNNNGAVDFKRLHAIGFRRVYLKLTEGLNFVDGKHDGYRRAALAAGLKVGEYHFAHPDISTGEAQAEAFCQHLPKLQAGKTLRPCLDLEAGTPSPAVAQWAARFVAYVRNKTGHRVVLYSNPSYLTGCHFTATTGPLWLAAYGRNDGTEYPYQIPKPWRHVAAHQYTSRATVSGVEGECDLSHVLRPLQLDVHMWPLR